ncbi:ADP-ribose glycohydrolase OARD1 [Clupea harengus]|uniref:ADP-ribose glycohydrolase OARD1 n=1 Tax=Clupea harengus TaxID=7950 RepID=A0A6P8FDS4_CLUHA|nr:ADP-ribose glycohydrolase OARD1 [Clupea harengus]XP_031421841.1 ADP-ribose glycohydrolase OARD1 [Clupea harengus]XP_042563553.1 ADP-ribose glycohydrolase OARD1 [Clupea harengus]
MSTGSEGQPCHSDDTSNTCKPTGEWNLQYVKGDLFSCPADESLAHCISEDCRMGAGIAVVFKKTFGGVEDLKAQKKLTGECAVLKRSQRYVYYLITKEKYNHKPTCDSLRMSLLAMKAHCWEKGVTRISMPRIGCGLDRLSWEDVEVMIKEIFHDTNICITVYTL